MHHALGQNAFNWLHRCLIAAVERTRSELRFHQTLASRGTSRGMTEGGRLAAVRDSGRRASQEECRDTLRRIWRNCSKMCAMATHAGKSPSFTFSPLPFSLWNCGELAIFGVMTLYEVRPPLSRFGRKLMVWEGTSASSLKASRPRISSKSARNRFSRRGCSLAATSISREMNANS